ncbi:GDSL esterase/lipase [Sesamum alatum]|uniref:GDSL esterase/lipase n=1 Tax=Sesamum alatum TaxID=300844 RepID=A0AAE2CZB7_9LAMI|nr:GDSL esterase/lipase [Sesamum alatum]
MAAVAYAIIFLILLASTTTSASQCYDSIISFGDSLADTGNFLLLSPPDNPPLCGRPPYGRTFFHCPTGRSCDGRLVIDFIAESLGLPLVESYIAGRNAAEKGRNFSKGVNFAVGGATALDTMFYDKRGIHNRVTNVTLETQLDWFKEFLAVIPTESLGLPLVEPYAAWKSAAEKGGSFSKGVNFAVAGATALDTTFFDKRGIHNLVTNASLGVQLDWFKQFLARIPDSRKFLKSSLVVMGEIGCNDYNYPILENIDVEVIRSFVPTVVNYIGSIIELGVKTMLVAGNLQLGCMPRFLTQYMTFSKEKDYDPKTGCLNWLNELSMICKGISSKSMLWSRRSYNFNALITCGSLPLADCCENPSMFVNWDGIHFTEAAYRWIAQGLIQGPYTHPHIKTLCPTISGDTTAGYYEH